MKKTSKTVNASSVNLKKPARRGSRYDPIFARMEKLDKGKAFYVDPKDYMDGKPDVVVFQNRLNVAMRRLAPKPPRGWRWSKRTTEDNRVAIMLVRKERA